MESVTCPCCKGTGKASLVLSLRIRRQMAGVMLKDMAVRCGLSMTALSGYENGRFKKMSPKVAREYAKL